MIVTGHFGAEQDETVDDSMKSEAQRSQHKQTAVQATGHSTVVIVVLVSGNGTAVPRLDMTGPVQQGFGSQGQEDSGTRESQGTGTNDVPGLRQDAEDQEAGHGNEHETVQESAESGADTAQFQQQGAGKQRSNTAQAKEKK